MITPIPTVPDILTPEQAAAYLQVDRETIYRYIRDGKLLASKLGRTYRIPKRSIDLLLWTTRTREDITLRDYTGQEVAEFMAADELDSEAQEITKRFSSTNELV
jgi:excisionase family DNA binding protein